MALDVMPTDFIPSADTQLGERLWWRHAERYLDPNYSWAAAGWKDDLKQDLQK